MAMQSFAIVQPLPVISQAELNARIDATRKAQRDALRRAYYGEAE